eukprot:1896269-Alexandrium_andersonii.AAC.1
MCIRDSGASAQTRSPMRRAMWVHPGPARCRTLRARRGWARAPARRRPSSRRRVTTTTPAPARARAPRAASTSASIAGSRALSR